MFGLSLIVCISLNTKACALSGKSRPLYHWLSRPNESHWRFPFSGSSKHSPKSAAVSEHAACHHEADRGASSLLPAAAVTGPAPSPSVPSHFYTILPACCLSHSSRSCPVWLNLTNCIDASLSCRRSVWRQLRFCAWCHSAARSVQSKSKWAFKDAIFVSNFCRQATNGEKGT